MPIVRVIIEEDGTVRSNLHFGKLSQEEADDLARAINAKLKEYQQKS
jgi:hypothetical protein